MQGFPGLAPTYNGFGESLGPGQANQAVARQGPYPSDSQYAYAQPAPNAACGYASWAAVTGVRMVPAFSSTAPAPVQRQHAAFTSTAPAPVQRQHGDYRQSGDVPQNHIGWIERRQQAFQPSDVRPINMVHNPDDYPASYRRLADHVVWGNVEMVASTDMSSGGNAQSGDSISSGSGSARRKLRNRRINPDEILWRSPQSSAQGSSSTGHVSDDGDDLNPTAASASGMPFGEVEYAPNPRGNISESEEEGAEQINECEAEWQDVSLEEILKLVPYDENGLPTSIGSIGHFANACKQPCVFSLRRKGCTNEVRCGFCHLPHERKRQRQRPKARPRPCKGKRERYRKHWENFKNQIEEHPETFNVDDVELPPSISSYERLKGKLVTRMRKHQDLVKSQRAEQQGDGDAKQVSSEVAPGEKPPASSSIFTL